MNRHLASLFPCMQQSVSQIQARIDCLSAVMMERASFSREPGAACGKVPFSDVPDTDRALEGAEEMSGWESFLRRCCSSSACRTIKRCMIRKVERLCANLQRVHKRECIPEFLFQVFDNKSLKLNLCLLCFKLMFLHEYASLISSNLRIVWERAGPVIQSSRSRSFFGEEIRNRKVIVELAASPSS